MGTETHEPTVQTNFNATNNHLSVAGSYFDPVGNQQFFAPWTLGYDAENRNTTVTSPLNGSGVFSYDGEGRRVKKVWAPYGGSPTTTYYVYNALGQLAAEYSTASAPAITSYVHADMLGSTRMVTSGSGETLECYDYEPFGRMLGSGVNNRDTGCYPSNPDIQLDSNLAQKFTGKERDTQTKLDFFGARYYSGAQGRFMVPDKPFADQDPDHPQTWNLYMYARNNPLRFIDENGEQSIEALRRHAIRLAWAQERQLVMRTGAGTRAWTKSELHELRMKGSVTGYAGHHINSVNGHPQLAGDPDNIGFLKERKGGEHYTAHNNGRYRIPTFGKLLNRSVIGLAALDALHLVLSEISEARDQQLTGIGFRSHLTYVEVYILDPKAAAVTLDGAIIELKGGAKFWVLKGRYRRWDCSEDKEECFADPETLRGVTIDVYEGA